MIVKVGMAVGRAETRAEKSTETRQHSGWEEIWRLMPIPTFHQLQVHACKLWRNVHVASS